MKKHCNAGYFVTEGFRSIFTHGLMSFAAVCMIISCLIIMGSFSLLALNADRLMSQMESENQFFAYIDETYTQEQIDALEEQVKQVPNVASVEFISREQAKEEYIAGQESELYSEMPDEVFRDRFSIHVVDLELFDDTVQAVRELPGIASYSADEKLAQIFVSARNVAAAIALILVAILAAVSLFIIANTIRLATFARREEIAIMKMCGATDGFVRWPFVVEGIIIGVVGALVAFGIQSGIYAGVYQAVTTGGMSTIITLVPFTVIWPFVLAVFLVVGVLIGAGGSVLAIRRFLKV